MSDGRPEFMGEKVQTYSFPHAARLAASGLPREMDRDFRESSLGSCADFSSFEEICFVSRPQRFQFGSRAIIVTRKINFSRLEESAPRGKGVYRQVKWIFPSIVESTYEKSFFTSLFNEIELQKLIKYTFPKKKKICYKFRNRWLLMAGSLKT